MSEENKDQLLKDIYVEVLHFFLNNPFEKARKEFWEWMTAYIYFRGEIIGGKEAGESLYFYEQLIDMINSLEGFLNKIRNLEEMAKLTV
ncbi:glutaredoxin-related protein [Filimonas zeae]|uniref:Uncharacterized protein n=1 Tax=Filimonas zeae TaxID=1737353 RepID=A0A917MVS8_9BACT|nr:hypothetical protein [Filimonas zeae]MDR6338783.1 glutaredoxin-related protein [Filimonas zeae]GGH66640.1 hypothetical protein GCM10011379_21010 [Filimonas zeae]